VDGTAKGNNRDLVRALRRDSDKGEAEAVALAVETEDVLLLMDERLGRETADHFDLACVGLIGVLIEAKENTGASACGHGPHQYLHVREERVCRRRNLRTMALV
jgi:hypothetical protein